MGEGRGPPQGEAAAASAERPGGRVGGEGRGLGKSGVTGVGGLSVPQTYCFVSFSSEHGRGVRKKRNLPERRGKDGDRD